MKKIRNLFAAITVFFALSMAGNIVNAEPGYVWLEAENGNISGNYQICDNENASGGKNVMLCSLNEEDAKVEFTFDIAETGSYDFKILSTDGTVLYLSKYRYMIDDSLYKYSSNPSLGDRIYNHVTMVGDVWLSWYSLTTQTLEAGTHKLTIRTNEPREADELLTLHGFDAVAITPTDWGWTPDGISKPTVTKKTEYNSAWYNFADVSDLNQPGLGVDGKGVGVIAAQPEGTKYSFPVKFKVSKEGTYDVYFCGAPAGVDYASDYSQYFVDGVEKGKVSDSPYYKNVGSAEATGGGCGMAWQRVERLDLDTNEHEIMFEIDSPRNMEDNAYVIGLRYLVIVPADIKYDFADCQNGAQIAAEFVKHSVTIDEDLENVTDDIAIMQKSINGSKIKWSSSKPEIIAEDGTVNRPGFYEQDEDVTLTATVEVTDYRTTEVFEKEFQVSVKKKEEYTVKNFALTYPDGKYFGQNPNGGLLQASVKVANNQNQEKEAILMIALYDEKGLMTDVKAQRCHLTDELQEFVVDMNIPEEKIGYSVETFLWTDMLTKNLIQDSLLVYEN